MGLPPQGCEQSSNRDGSCLTPLTPPAWKSSHRFVTTSIKLPPVQLRSARTGDDAGRARPITRGPVYGPSDLEEMTLNIAPAPRINRPYPPHLVERSRELLHATCAVFGGDPRAAALTGHV